MVLDLRLPGVVDGLLLRLGTGSYCPQPEHGQGTCQRPGLREVLLDVDKLVPQALAGVADAPDNLLDGVLVHEIIQSQLVGVLKFELVVVGQ